MEKHNSCWKINHVMTETETIQTIYSLECTRQKDNKIENNLKDKNVWKTMKVNGILSAEATRRWFRATKKQKVQDIQHSSSFLLGATNESLNEPNSMVFTFYRETKRSDRPIFDSVRIWCPFRRLLKATLKTLNQHCLEVSPKKIVSSDQAGESSGCPTF